MQHETSTFQLANEITWLVVTRKANDNMRTSTPTQVGTWKHPNQPWFEI